MLLDEPTAFLDEDGRRRLSRVLSGCKERGACIVLAGHEFAGLEPLIDRQVLLGQPRRETAPAEASAMRTDLGPTILAAEGLSASSDGREVFSGLDLELRAGEIVGLCGPNGSGKSTLARILGGMEVPAAGRVLLSGEPADKAKLWRAVAVAGQNPYPRPAPRYPGTLLRFLPAPGLRRARPPPGGRLRVARPGGAPGTRPADLELRRGSEGGDPLRRALRAARAHHR